MEVSFDGRVPATQNPEYLDQESSFLAQPIFVALRDQLKEDKVDFADEHAWTSFLYAATLPDDTRLTPDGAPREIQPWQNTGCLPVKDAIAEFKKGQIRKPSKSPPVPQYLSTALATRRYIASVPGLLQYVHTFWHGREDMKDRATPLLRPDGTRQRPEDTLIDFPTFFAREASAARRIQQLGLDENVPGMQTADALAEYFRSLGKGKLRRFFSALDSDSLR